MTLVGSMRARAYAASIAARAEEYGARPTSDERAAIQLELLNREWARIAAVVPYYRQRIERRELPSSFASLAEFTTSVSPTTRADVQADLAGRTSQGRRADFQRITGGSTAQPVQLPAWSSEVDHTRLDMWLGRSWYGVTPASRLFMLWGHSHLLGTGAAGWLRARRMELSDRLLGYYRHSAYDMRHERLREAAEAMTAFRPDYMIGYSVALERFAEANADRHEQLGRLGMRVVLGAAEGFPSADGPARLEALFRCPVAMEYGSVETGLVAHTMPEGGYLVFWRSYLLDVEPHQAGWRVRVTSLFPRSFPLVRYDLGDEVELDADEAARRIGLARLRRVAGRCNDYVRLDDGTLIHSEAFTHAVRACPDVRGYQIVGSGAAARVRYVAASSLTPEAERGIRDRLSKIHPALGGLTFERVAELEHTIAGKTRMVVPE